MSKNRWSLTKVTPLIMFWTWLQMVRTVASSFLLPHHLSTRSWGQAAGTQIKHHHTLLMHDLCCQCLSILHWLNTKLGTLISYLFVLLAQKAKLQVDVVELPDEFPAGPLDDDRPPLQPHLDCWHTTHQQDRNQVLLKINARRIMELSTDRKSN